MAEVVSVGGKGDTQVAERVPHCSVKAVETSAPSVLDPY